MNRTTTIIVIAAALIGVVLAGTWLLGASGVAGSVKYASQPVWSQPFDDIQSVKIVKLSPDNEHGVFVEGANGVTVLTADGQPLFSRDAPAPHAVTLGDIDRSGVDDLIIASPAADGIAVTALDLRGRVLWDTTVAGLSAPSRAATIRFPEGIQVVVGDDTGRLAALASDGSERWRAALSSGNYIRGMDELKTANGYNLVAANYDGSVAAYDATGRELWSDRLGEPVRRLRAFEGPQGSFAAVGGENGRVLILSGAEGSRLADASLGDRVTEIRSAELDGDPGTREFVVGGRNGGVWAFRSDGARLWASRVGDRVQEIAGLDLDGNGTDEVLVGDEAGAVAVLDGKTGTRSDVAGFDVSSVRSFDTGRLTAPGQVAIAGPNAVELVAVSRQSAPFWYSPLIAGVLLSLVIGGAAWVLVTMPSRAVVRAAAEDQSAEGLQAQYKMLHESLADVERLRGEGEMPADTYLERLRELRGELARTEAALLKAGVPIKPETFSCPNCGGTLTLGTDKCDYCGKVVIA